MHGSIKACTMLEKYLFYSKRVSLNKCMYKRLECFDVSKGRIFVETAVERRKQQSTTGKRFFRFCFLYACMCVSFRFLLLCVFSICVALGSVLLADVFIRSLLLSSPIFSSTPPPSPFSIHPRPSAVILFDLHHNY